MSFDKEKDPTMNGVGGGGYPPLQGHLQQQQQFYNAGASSQNTSGASSPSVYNTMPLYGNNGFSRFPQQQQQSQPQQQSQQQQSQQQQQANTIISDSSNSVHVTRQLTYAQNSRQSSSPHHHARTAAAMARSTPVASTVTITDPNNPNKVFNRIDNINTSSSNSNEKQTWTTLDIGGMGLKQISPTLCSYKFLTVLYMNHNNLTNLTSDIARLVNLKTLDCSGNKLATLPPELGMLVNLRDLLLFDNNLTSLPNELGMLYQLEMLGLDGNPIQTEIKNILMKEGTQAVIMSLRENAPGNFFLCILIHKTHIT